jgi:formylglycine-generating enzyme required for sulfatase activity
LRFKRDMRIAILPLLFCPVLLMAQLGIRSKDIPGVQPLKGDYLYIDETEVSNQQYAEYMQWLRSKGFVDSLRSNYPDTTCWMASLGFNEPFKIYYFQHPAYRNYPVVGITQRQAENFCQWRRDRILENFKANNIPIEDILVRLPSQAEWEYAARGGQSEHAIYPWPGESVRITKDAVGKYKTPSENYKLRQKDVGMARMNFKSWGSELGNGTSTGAFITTPVNGYWPNAYGLYNMSGNVAEWVQEPGVSKGGSWMSTPYECRIDAVASGTGRLEGQNTIGFRCVIEIVRLPAKTKEWDLRAKDIEAAFGYFRDSLQAGTMEVTNLWYRKFVEETGLAQHAPNDTLWLQYDRYKWHLMYSKYQEFNAYPVVNISYEGAVAYCNWLTKKYASLEGRRYADKQVVFRLPTAEEWRILASGGRIGNTYPWGGPYARNSRGCFLSNFHPKPEYAIAPSHSGSGASSLLAYDTSEARSADGCEFTCAVDSYFPNDFGLYNCSGNAAEMVAEKGKSCGGSWDSDLYWLRVNYIQGTDGMVITPNTDSYAGPSPELGFRVLMEIR